MNRRAHRYPAGLARIGLCLPAAIALGAVGCREPGLGELQLRKVDPDVGPDNRAVEVVITADNFEPLISTNFHEQGRSKLDDLFSVRLGRESLAPVPLRDVRLVADGAACGSSAAGAISESYLCAVVPEGMTPGSYDLTVVDPHRRTASLGYRVLSSEEQGELIASYRFEPIGPDQEVFAPFPVTIAVVDAKGDLVTGFSGSVSLTDQTGSALPKSAGLFRFGQWTGMVEVRLPHGADTLKASDDRNRTGESNPFQVAMRPPAALVFATPPRTAQAGACSAAVTVELRDAFGAPVKAASAVRAALVPSQGFGFGLYQDAACAVPLAGLDIAAGSPGADLHFKGTRAGPVILAASASGFRGATQVQTVAPALPDKLVFLTDPQVLNAGACSQVATLQARDVYDNPSPAGPAILISLAASPPGGFGFFQDATCATPATSTPLATGSDRADFYFRGTIARLVRVTASAPNLTAANQDERINPEGVATRLVFVTAPQTVEAGTCSGLATIQTQDSFGNVVAGAGATQVGLGATPASRFAFYADSGCTATTTGLTIGANQSTASFFFRGTLAGNVGVTAAATGLTPASQIETISVGPPARLSFVTAPQSVVAGTCSAVATVQVQDAFGNASPVAAAASLALAAAPAIGIGFFLDAGCATSVAGVPVPAGGTQASFYFKSTAAGNVAVATSEVALGSAAQTESIGPAAASKLAFLTAPKTTTAGACSGVVTVEVQDSFGNAAPVGAATSVSLAALPASGFGFYSNAGCTAAVTQTAVAAAASAASFFYRGTAAGSVATSASASGLAAATQTETVVPAAPDRLAFTTPARTATAGTCSAVLTVQAQDPFGNPSNLAAATSVSLFASPAAGFAFYASAACTAGSETTGLTIAGGSNSASFYFKGTVAGTVSVAAVAAGLISATQAQAVAPAPPDRLVFVTPPQTVAAGACSAIATLQSRDGFGNASSVSASTPTSLTAAPGVGFVFYSDATCGTAVTSAILAAGSSATSFYFRGTAAGAVTVNASAAGLTAASQAETVNPAAPAKLAFITAVQALTAGSCSAVMTVQSQDGFGNPSAVGAATSVTLSTSSTGGTLHSGSTCATAATTATIAAGTTTASFYYRDTKAGAPTLTASAAGLTSASQTETINPAPPTKLAFTTAPQTMTAGTCSGAVAVQTQDSYGNGSNLGAATPVSLSTTSTAGTFYATSTCGTAITSLTIAAGANSGTFYYGDTLAGAPALTAAATGLTSASQTGTINPGPPAMLAFTTAAQTLTAGTCSAAATVQSQDSFGNPSNVAAATTVGLLASPSIGFTFYSDAGCTAAVPSATIPAGASAASFFFNGTAAGAVSVTASAAGLTSASQTETINPGPPAKLAFTTGAQTLVAGSCSVAITVQSQDGFSNPSNVGTASSVTLTTSSAGGTFYSDSTCATAITGVTIAAGANSASFYYKDTVAGTPTLTAPAAGLTSGTQTETINPGPPVKLAFATAPQTLSAGACSAVMTVQSQDTLGNASNVAAATAVALTTTSAGGAFHGGSTCATAITGATLAAGTNAFSFYYKDTTAGTPTLTASAGGLTSATQTQTVSPAGAPTQLAFFTVPQTLVAGACSAIMTVQSQDGFGNPSNVTAATAVALATTSTGGTFHSDSTCATAVAGVTIAAGANAASFYYKDTKAPGTPTLTASSGGLTSATQTQTVNPGPPVKLAFTTVPQTLTAGACSAAMTLQSQDSFNNPSNLGAVTSVALTTPSVGGAFYSDGTCATLVTAVTIAAGGNTASFHYKDTKAGTPTLTAAATGLTSATQTETINPAPPTKLVFTTAAQTSTAGACSAVMTLQSQDSFNNPSNVGAATSVTLTTPSTGGTFYSDSTCATAVAGVTLAAGGNAASFYYKDTKAGAPTLTASATGLTIATQTETINPAPPVKLAFTTASQTMIAGACSGAITVQTQDAYGNASSVGAATLVSLSTTSTPGTFYATSTCGTAITTVTIAAGTDSATFHYGDTLAGTPSIAATATGLTPASQIETVNPAPPAKLAFTTPAQTLTAGACSAAATVQSQDTFGNPSNLAAATAVALSAAPPTGFTFHSDAGCATAVATVTIAAGANTASFFFKGTAAGAVTVTASATGLTVATQSETINAGPPIKLAFATPAQTLAAGACSGIITVQSQDSFNNPSNLGAATAVGLVTTSAGGTLYSDSTCTTAVAGATIAAGANAASFYYKDTAAGTPILTASATGLTSATQTETVNPGPPFKLAFTTAAQTLTAGACSAVMTLQSQDSFNNPSNVGAATSVTLTTSSAGGTFYSDGTCASLVTAATIAAGANTASFYYKDTAPGTPTLTAAATGLTSATQTETINAGPPVKLGFATAAQTLTAGSCSTVITVQSQDILGNPSNVGAATAVGLTTTSAGGTFYSDSTCATAIAGVTIAAGANTASFYYKDNAAGTPTLTASATGLSSAAQTETINPGPPVKLGFTTVAQTLTAGACSAVMTVQSQDSFNNPSNVGAATSVTLGTTSLGGAFYSDATCLTVVTAVTIAAGANTASFYYKDTAAGTPTLTASATGLAPAGQIETINPGPTTQFTWDTIASPQGLSVAFGVTVRARDAFANPTPAFVGTAGLSVAPAAATVSCTTACTDAVTTGPFTAGVWTGSVTAGGTAGPGRQLTATSGAIVGPSNLFATTEQPLRSPPTAAFTYLPTVVVAGGTVSFDASSSSDYQTPTASLAVRWDFLGSGTWTLPTTTKTATNVYSTAGTYSARLEVKDLDNDVGYVDHLVVVLAAAGGLCVVDVNTDIDNGTACGSPGLSLREAVIRSNATAGRQTITFSGPMTISATATYTLTDQADLIAPAGVILSTAALVINKNTHTFTISGLEMTGQATAIDVRAGTATIRDTYIHDAGTAIQASGPTTLLGVRLINNTTTGVFAEDSLTMRYSEVRGTTGGNPGVDVDTCPGATVRDLQSNVFAANGTGVRFGAACSGSLIRHNTFHANTAVGVEYGGGTGHVLRNNIFTSQGSEAFLANGATYANQDFHVLWQNGVAGCGGGCTIGPSTINADPLYAWAANNDFRLRITSPALDSTLDMGLDVNGPAAPGNFFGVGPDRGGRETW